MESIVFRKLKLEWLYRISSHPHGFEKLKDLLLFMLLVLRKKITSVNTKYPLSV